MFLRSKKIDALLIGTLIALGVSGCGGTSQVKPQTEAYTTEKSGIQRAEARAQQALALESPARDQALLEAAELYHRDGRTPEAENLLEQVDSALLDGPHLAHYSLLRGGIALHAEQYFLARDLLDNPRLANAAASLPPDQRLRWHRLKGELYGLIGNRAGSLEEYSAAVALLSDTGEIRALHDRIWLTLNQLSDTEITDNALRTQNATIRGWYRLAAEVRGSQGDIARQVERIRQWQQRNGNHAAARVLPTSLQQVISIEKATPRQIALVLPASGNFKLAGDTVRDGVLSAYYDVLGNGGSVPAIRIYDDGDGEIDTLYQRAVAEGADMVIGPLRKDRLTALTAAPALPVPVLGLNYLEDTTNTHDNFYQFGLSIRDEAAQIAERAWIAGHRSVLAITPQTGWGESALAAFREQWQARGGHIASAVTYSGKEVDYTPLLEPMFLVRHSRERAQRLQQVLGKNVAYVPTRRRDLDMILLIAYPQDGRQIKPTLDFLYAADLPVYATSHIYDGKQSAALNKDLDGIQFTAMPWSIKALSSGTIQPRASLPGSYRNLFAMGIDAYRLHQWLELLKALPEAEIHGYTGSLSLGDGNAIVRKQPWAYFDNGVAKPAPALGEGVAKTQ